MKRLMMYFIAIAMCVPTISAFAEGRLIIYCSNEPFACQAVADEFAKKYDVKVQMTRAGSGSTYAKILAEKDNPKGDVWYAGTLDPHSQAGVNGLLESYKSPMLKEIGEKFKNPATSQQHHSAGVYAGVLGYSVNTKLLKEENLPMPRSWEDLTKPEYKGMVQVASPQSSGTAYTVLATMVQLKGEDGAFKYLARLHKNVNQYTKSGSAPGKAAARGETLIGIGFLHDHALQKSNGFPLELIVPSEGTGYEIGGLSIIKKARNLENAKKFVDFMLSAEGQEVPQRVKMFQVPTNINANVPKEAIRLDEVNLIDYDFVKYGSEKMRANLIDRWVKEIKPLKR
ncbi:MAG: ABC transporter substrate-binding protein [Desulfobacula sp.]|uniref:ABC transporter substrate-binding protein n=1 Tax=Desulfobacula sp. TaxID=2593537 RepID=UPI0025BECD73|nr:ABC transporter substrate-binding protein [Desulfobacula sp.]MCD4719506.1 ABC transporter substrate-binding protein [Desulfobacula sp.]